MSPDANVLEYKCPCCGAGLRFGNTQQKMTCAYCDNSFDLEAVQVFNESLEQPSEPAPSQETVEHTQWSEEECGRIQSFVCTSCGGELVTDEHTAATFCPYCGNPTILPGRVSGGLKPEGVIPFQKSQEDAIAAFLKLCRGKPLLPKMFTQEQQLEKLTGIYVPFWLYDCQGDIRGSYKATRLHHWSDSRYQYTKTDHYMLTREALAAFRGVPMDGSSKMEDSFMESIEPFDYTHIVDFDTAYLSGFFADKFDVPASEGEERLRQRVGKSMDELIQSSFVGYATTVPTSRQIHLSQRKERYVLLPVWLLNIKYRGKTYTFAMNGQTGKMTGTLPICPKRSAAWFAGIMAGATVLISVIQTFML